MFINVIYKNFTVNLYEHEKQQIGYLNINKIDKLFNLIIHVIGNSYVF